MNQTDAVTLATLGAQIASTREARRLTVEDAARAANLDPTTWHKIEAGRHDPDYLSACAIAGALSVPIGVLVRTVP